jgi:Fe-S-cluster containining protein
LKQIEAQDPMEQNTLDDLFKNYTDLLARVDAHIAEVMKTHEPHIACKKGCDDCCRFLNLFPVEAFALSRAFEALEESHRAKVLEQMETAPDRCPLLVNHVCMLYPARPIICRTHGFPIYMEKEGELMVDFCPENFKDLTTLPKEVLLDLDQLNILLTAVNQHFIAHFDGDLPDRIPVSQALDLWSSLDME